MRFTRPRSTRSVIVLRSVLMINGIRAAAHDVSLGMLLSRMKCREMEGGCPVGESMWRSMDVSIEFSASVKRR